MALRFEAVTFEVADADAVAAFWAGLLDRQMLAEPGGVLVPGDELQVGLRFEASDGKQVGRPRLHVHLTSSSREDQQRTVETALRLGGRHLDVGQGPDDPHVVLADPGGNELCVIEPGNAFLAGCGRLGSITCEGTREVGYFWSAALGWPLVWDQDEETAIRAPDRTGPMITWSGPPLPPKLGRNRWSLAVAPLDRAQHDAEVGRLVALGATRLDTGDGDRDPIVLADPDGNEFCVVTTWR